MERETARALLQTIADIAAITFDAQVKLTALENVLQDRDPDLYQAYREEVEHLRKKPPYAANLEGYSTLLEKLSH